MIGAGDDVPPEQDRVTLFAMPPALRTLAAEAVTAVEDRPASCQHTNAPLICSAHVDLGPLCLNCAQDHLLGHGLLTDGVCSSCNAMDASVLFGWLPGGPDYQVLVRLCRSCRTGDTETDDTGG